MTKSRKMMMLGLLAVVGLAYHEAQQAAPSEFGTFKSVKAARAAVAKSKPKLRSVAK